MPVPTLVTDLSTTLASNSPAGSDNVFPDLDNYLRALSGFVASIRDNSGNGWVSPYLPLAGGTVTGATIFSSTVALNGALSGTGLTTYLASPPAIGGTTPAAGSFTTLSASGNVTLSGGTANGVLYLNGSKVATSGSALTYNGTTLTADTASTTAANFRIENGTYNRVGSFRLTTDGVQFDSFDQNNAASTRQFMWLSGGTEAMRLTSTGLGIGTSSPSTKLEVSGSAAVARVSGTAGTVPQLSLSSAGVVNWTLRSNNDGASDFTIYQDATQRLKIDSSGNLGIGTSSPAAKLNTAGNSSANQVPDIQITRSSSGTIIQTGPNITFSDGTTNNTTTLQVTQGRFGVWNYGAGAWNERMSIDASGNLGLGVTPSAWINVGKAIEIGDKGTGIWGRPLISDYVTNAYYSSTGYKYAQPGPSGAGRYTVSENVHSWHVAPSGTAGNAISFTQAMTLDASANLQIGRTTSSGSPYKLELNSTADTRFALSVGTTLTGGIDAAANLMTLVAYGVSTPMTFQVNGAERARITSGGYFKASNTGTYAGSSAGYHEFYQTNNADTVRLTSTSTAVSGAYGLYVDLTVDPNATDSFFVRCFGGATQRASIRSNGGLANYSANDVNLSDRREKTNFAPAKSYLDTICAIPVQTFNYIDQSEDDPGLTLGVVAQDVQAVAPELVMESNWGTEDTPKMRLSIYQTDLQYALMKCVQELKAELDATKARLAALEAQP